MAVLSARVVACIILAVSLALALPACGGGVSSQAPSLVTVTLSVTVPNRSGSGAKRTGGAITRLPASARRAPRRSAHGAVMRLRGKATRRPEYVSPDTQSAKFSALDSTGKVVASAYANCTATCATKLAVIPGTYTFRIDLYDGPNGTGNLLSSGSATTTIGTTPTTVDVAIGGGTVAFVDLTLEPAAVLSGTAQTLTLFVDAEDADGNFIDGSDPYTNPITLSTSDATNLKLSATSVTMPGQTITVKYSGAASASLVISGTASGAEGDTAFLSVDGATPPPQVVGPGDDPVQIYHKPGAGTASPNPPPTPEPPLVSPTPGPVAALAVAPAVSVFGSGRGYTAYDAINPTSSKAYIGFGSLNNVENSTSTIAQSNFQVSVSAGGLQTFSLRKTVIDLKAHRGAVPALPPDYHPPYALDRRRALGRGVAYARRKMALPTIGATQTFYVGSTQQTFTAQALTNNNRAVIWTANTLPADATAPATITQFTTMAQNSLAAIDTLIGTNSYPANAAGIQTYGQCDNNGKNLTDNNGNQLTGPGTVADPGYVNVAVYDSGALAAADNLGNALGFFSSNDFTPRAIGNCNAPPASSSNETEIVFIKWTAATTRQFAVMQGTFTHEYGHLVTFVQKSILQNGNYDKGWLLEGLGTLTEDYTSPSALAQGNLGNPTQPIYDVDNSMQVASAFLSEPQNFTLTGFAGIENNSYETSSATNYGLSYLFLKYLTDRFGHAFVKQMNTTTDVGATNIANAAGRRCGCTLTFAQLFSDFVTMLAVSNTGVSNDPRYNLQSFSLRQTYTNPVTGTSLTLTGPATVGTLTPGQNATVQSMFRGGFAFFSFDNFSPNGSTIRVDDLTGGGLGLFGAIGQR